jgi:tetratricopeptide (TPR) repeat protein
LCQRALELDSTLGDGWLLLALLLSCGRQLPEAGHACLGGLAEFPEHVELLLMQLKLASEQSQHQEALGIVQKVADAAGLENFVDGLPQFTVHKSSPVDSSTALHSRLNSHRVKVMLAIAEAYLASKSNSDGPHNMIHYAVLCVQLAQTLAPIGSLGAADCRVALGSIDELHERPELARAHYEAALSISSSHVGAHVRLAKLLLTQSDTQSAHAHLKSATRTNAAVPEVWLMYARALRATPGARHGVDATASEALLTALELERASPLLSFANVARTIGA